MKHSIGQSIRENRKKLSLSLRGFADVVGISHSHLSKIENGDVMPSKEMFEKILNSLHLNEAEYEKLLDSYLEAFMDGLNIFPIGTLFEQREIYDYTQEPGRVNRPKWTLEDTIRNFLLTDDENILSYKEAELLAEEMFDFYKVRLRSIKREAGDKNSKD